MLQKSIIIFWIYQKAYGFGLAFYEGFSQILVYNSVGERSWVCIDGSVKCGFFDIIEEHLFRKGQMKLKVASYIAQNFTPFVKEIPSLHNMGYFF